MESQGLLRSGSAFQAAARREKFPAAGERQPARLTVPSPPPATTTSASLSAASRASPARSAPCAVQMRQSSSRARKEVTQSLHPLIVAGSGCRVDKRHGRSFMYERPTRARRAHRAGMKPSSIQANKFFVKNRRGRRIRRLRDFSWAVSRFFRE